MIVKNRDQRVVVLVDVQNLYYSAKNLYQAKVNFKNLLNIVLADRTLVRAIAYVIEADSENKHEKEFFDALNSAGFEVKQKALQIFYGGAKKGDWDIGIAMDAIRLGNKVDSIVLISGDGDFRPVVNYLQQSLGCLVEVVAFSQSANNELIEMADDYINIEDYRETLLIRYPKPSRKNQNKNVAKPRNTRNIVKNPK
jgi:uncharacterized LabA/DUF88 family protein